MVVGQRIFKFNQEKNCHWDSFLLGHSLFVYDMYLVTVTEQMMDCKNYKKENL